MIRNTQSIGKKARTGKNHENFYDRQHDRKMRKGWGTWEARQGKSMWVNSFEAEVEVGIEEYQAMLADEKADVLVVEQKQSAEVHYLSCHGPDGQFVYDRDMHRVRKVA